MAMHLDPISSITPAKVNWRIKVKIVRLWRLKCQGSPKSIEMVVMDDNGIKIHGSISREFFPTFYFTIFQGFTYNMGNFTVSENSEYFPSTAHPFELHFRDDTFVHQINDFPITRSPYSFVRLPDVLNIDVSYTYLIDVIGVLTKVGMVEEFNVHGSVEKIVRFDLSAAGTKIECALMGNFVNEYVDFVSAGHAHGAIVLIQLSKVKTLPGTTNRYIAAIFEATRIFYRPTF